MCATGKTLAFRLSMFLVFEGSLPTLTHHLGGCALDLPPTLLARNLSALTAINKFIAVNLEMTKMYRIVVNSSLNEQFVSTCHVQV